MSRDWIDFRRCFAVPSVNRALSYWSAWPWIAISACYIRPATTNIPVKRSVIPVIILYYVYRDTSYSIYWMHLQDVIKISGTQYTCSVKYQQLLLCISVSLRSQGMYECVADRFGLWSTMFRQVLYDYTMMWWWWWWWTDDSPLNWKLMIRERQWFISGYLLTD